MGLMEIALGERGELEDTRRKTCFYQVGPQGFFSNVGYQTIGVTR